MLIRQSRICCACKTTLFNNILAAFFIALLVFGPVSALAVDESYLKALEVEAEKSAQLGTKKQQGKKSSTKQVMEKNKKGIVQFEHILQDSRPATYRFYQKLNDKEKTLVYTIYQKDRKLSQASKTVFDLYFEKNK